MLSQSTNSLNNSNTRVGKTQCSYSGIRLFQCEPPKYLSSNVNVFSFAIIGTFKKLKLKGLSPQCSINCFGLKTSPILIWKMHSTHLIASFFKCLKL